MPQTLDVSDFLAAAGPILDVRAPVEYVHGQIPGALSFPLFTDEERAEIGTLYHKQGQQAAVLRALEIWGPKMAEMVRAARKLAPEGQVRVHCWRGGQRSGAVAWLLEQAGFDVGLLVGGYKAYRREVLASFARPWQLVLIGGLTGSGKTELLQALSELGEQTIDLEALAGHRGSAFGGLGLPPQPSPEQFENNLHAQLAGLDPRRPLWLEDESTNIGQIVLPLALREQMQQAPVLALDLPRELRLQRLIGIYAPHPPEALAACVEKIRKRMGGARTQACLAALAEGQPEVMIERVLDYYDKGYRHSLSDRATETLTLSQDDPPGAARQLLELYQRVEAPMADGL